MPRETIEVPVSFGGLAEAAALLISFVAYPAAEAATQRRKFALALRRLAVEHRASKDRRWAERDHGLPPEMLLASDAVAAKAFEDGWHEFFRFTLVAKHFVTPHLIALETKRPPKLDTGVVANIQNAAFRVMDEINWRGSKSKTFELQYWGPSKPVIHMGYAIGAWVNVFARSETGIDFLITLLTDASMPMMVLPVAEGCRLKLPGTYLNIQEHETIRFVDEREYLLSSLRLNTDPV